MAVEVGDAEAVVWTRPDDYPYDEQDPAARLIGGMRGGGFNALFCDGSVRFVRAPFDQSMLNAVFTRNGGERIEY